MIKKVFKYYKPQKKEALSNKNTSLLLCECMTAREACLRSMWLSKDVTLSHIVYSPQQSREMELALQKISFEIFAFYRICTLFASGEYVTSLLS